MRTRASITLTVHAYPRASSPPLTTSAAHSCSGVLDRALCGLPLALDDITNAPAPRSPLPRVRATTDGGRAAGATFKMWQRTPIRAFHLDNTYQFHGLLRDARPVAVTTDSIPRAFGRQHAPTYADIYSPGQNSPRHFALMWHVGGRRRATPIHAFHGRTEGRLLAYGDGRRCVARWARAERGAGGALAHIRTALALGSRHHRAHTIRTRYRTSRTRFQAFEGIPRDFKYGGRACDVPDHRASSRLRSFNTIVRLLRRAQPRAHFCLTGAALTLHARTHTHLYM